MVFWFESFHVDTAVVVAVVAVGVVQVAVDQVVHVVAVRDGFVAATGTVHVVGIVAVAVVAGRAVRRVGVADFQLVLDDGAVGFLVMEVAVMQVIHMIAVFDRSVSAIRSMFVIVIGVNVFRHFGVLSFRE